MHHDHLMFQFGQDLLFAFLKFLNNLIMAISLQDLGAGQQFIKCPVLHILKFQQNHRPRYVPIFFGLNNCHILVLTCFPIQEFL